MNTEIITEFFEFAQIDRYEALWYLYNYVNEFDQVKRLGNIAIIKLIEAAIDLGYITRYSDDFSSNIENLYDAVFDELSSYLESRLNSSKK